MGRPSNRKFSTWLSSKCGSIARRFAPLQLESWGELILDDFNALFERVKTKFIIDMNDPQAYKCVHITIAKAYGEMRYELADKIRSYPNFEVARRNCPNNISKDDWDFLINLFSSKKFQMVVFRDENSTLRVQSLSLSLRSRNRSWGNNLDMSVVEAGVPLCRVISGC